MLDTEGLLQGSHQYGYGMIIGVLPLYHQTEPCEKVIKHLDIDSPGVLEKLSLLG